MISKKLVKALLSTATKDRKDAIIEELLNHVSINYDYNDQKAGHILEMLVDDNAVITVEAVNIKFFENNINFLVYEPEKYNIRNIKVRSVDNIDGIVQVEFECLEKVNEDRDDVTYVTRTQTINYLDHPDILKNVK